MQNSSRTLSLAPLPLEPARREKHDWVSQITLSSWSDFEAPDDFGDDSNSSEEPAGRVELSLLLPEDTVALPPEHRAALEHLLQNEEALRDAILEALLRQYPQWQPDYGYEDEFKYLMPDVTSVNDFRSLLRLSSVYLLSETRDGTAYVGLSFDCTWDVEHAFGALTHRSRVVELGGAEVSFGSGSLGADVEE